MRRDKNNDIISTEIALPDINITLIDNQGLPLSGVLTSEIDLIIITQ